MFISAIGLLMSDLFMIAIILLNNVGPAWEVPVVVIMLIAGISLALVASLAFWLIMWMINRKAFLRTRRSFSFSIL